MWCWKELLVSPGETDEMSLQFRGNKPSNDASQISNDSTPFKAPRQAPSSVGHLTRYISFCVNSVLEVWSVMPINNRYLQCLLLGNISSSNPAPHKHQLSPKSSGYRNRICLQCSIKHCLGLVSFICGPTSALVFQLLKDRI